MSHKIQNEKHKALSMTWAIHKNNRKRVYNLSNALAIEVVGKEIELTFESKHFSLQYESEIESQQAWKDLQEALRYEVGMVHI